MREGLQGGVAWIVSSAWLIHHVGLLLHLVLDKCSVITVGSLDWTSERHVGVVGPFLCLNCVFRCHRCLHGVEGHIEDGVRLRRVLFLCVVELHVSCFTVSEIFVFQSRIKLQRFNLT